MIKCFQSIERSVKSVELTCNPTFTMSHDISLIIQQLPSETLSDIREKLYLLWEDVPDPLRIYTCIMYKGLNGNTGQFSYINLSFLNSFHF